MGDITEKVMKKSELTDKKLGFEAIYSVNKCYTKQNLLPGWSQYRYFETNFTLIKFPFIINDIAISTTFK